MSQPKVLVVDDDLEMRNLLQDFLKRGRFGGTKLTVEQASSGEQALQCLHHSTPDLLISDLKMAEMDGLQLLDKVRTGFPSTTFILITAFGSIDSAIEAMKRGAFDYIVKPFKLTEMQVAVEKALQQNKLVKENAALRAELKRERTPQRFIGRSKAMKELYDLVERVAPFQAPVLITGESGTGKEMVAKALHQLSPRQQAPFIALNCTALPETLLESELFGHAKGSFTGATQRKKGLFEEASGGTLFLDEIGDMSPALQSKLLRVLQEKSIRPVGDTQNIDVDVRVLSATHKDLGRGVREGWFREDLYYRINVIPIHIPPLRSRREDIGDLAQHFLERFALLHSQPPKTISREALQRLTTAPWKGNVRELENTLERAAVLARSPEIQTSDLSLSDPTAEALAPPALDQSFLQGWPSVFDLEKNYIELVLQKTGGHKEKAAQILGINRRTLYRKEREYGWVSAPSSEDSDADAFE